MGDDGETQFRDNPELSRYELRLGETLVGTLVYEVEQAAVVLIHTEVDPDFEGRGLGSRLVAEALADIRARGLSVVPVCPFVSSYLRRHPEYRDLVAPEPASRS